MSNGHSATRGKVRRDAEVAARATRSGSGAEPPGNRYPAGIWLLLAGSLLVRSAGFAYPFLAYHVAGRTHATGAVGAVLATYGVGWATGQLLCGWLVDRCGARTTLVSTMSVAAVVLMLMAGARSVPVLLLGAAIAGLACQAPRPVLSATIANVIPDPQQRARLDSWSFGWVLNIGGAITAGVGGLVAGWVGGTSLLYRVNGIACAIFAVVAACCISEKVHRPPDPAGPARGDYRQAFSDKRLLLLVASGLATLTSLMGFFAAVPMLMSACGLGASAYGWVQLANASAVIALTPLMTPWLSKLLAIGPRLDILACAGAWVTLCMGAAGLAHTTAGFGAAAAACSPGEIAWFVVGTGIVHRIAPPANSGRYHGIWSMTTAAASVTAPILASCSLVHSGRLLMATTTVTVGLLGTALCAPLARVLLNSNESPCSAEIPADE